MIDITNAVITAISLTIQSMVVEGQISYVTESAEILGLRQYHYRRVLYYDIRSKGSDKDKSDHERLRLVNLIICSLTALLLVPRYWH